jgi:hypothetical protein
MVTKRRPLPRNYRWNFFHPPKKRNSFFLVPKLFSKTFFPGTLSKKLSDRSEKNLNQLSLFNRPVEQGCQIFLGTYKIPKREKNKQKLSQYIQNGHKIYKMAVK